jgi:hypothetical protein
LIAERDEIGYENLRKVIEVIYEHEGKNARY